ncbi:hypothetical protein ANRL2_01403 [Anaerolineae bacterium]|nr:hypothetical protein ANRL2_01403 [Anaerolineae bacterium]
MRKASPDTCIRDGSRTPRYPVALTRAEAMWIDVIRHASRDGDVLPTLRRVHQVRALFRDFADERSSAE